MFDDEFSHRPVLVPEVLTHLDPRPGERVFDLTAGGGGHAAALLAHAAHRAANPKATEPVALTYNETGFPDPPPPPAVCELIGLDRDPAAVATCNARLASRYAGRVKFFIGRFSQLRQMPDLQPLLPADVILADLGVSSHQFDTAARGFSFTYSGPLDMRMTPEAGPTARDILIRLREPELAQMFRDYGEERFAGRIARRIKEALAADRDALRTTAELAELIRDSVPGGKAKGARIHPATRVFQALRIYVNAELAELEALLAMIPEILAPGGRLGIISFHSLEDRRVKQAFRALHVAGNFAVRTKKPIAATDAEIAANPRARSAKLRVLARLRPGDSRR